MLNDIVLKTVMHTESHDISEDGLVKRDFASKVCSLLVDGGIGNGKGLNQYQSYKYRYVKLQKRNPKAIWTLERQFRNALDDAKMLLDQF